MKVSPAELMRWLRDVAAEAADAGFTEFRITGSRMSGVGPGRRIDFTIHLQKGQP